MQQQKWPESRHWLSVQHEHGAEMQGTVHAWLNSCCTERAHQRLSKTSRFDRARWKSQQYTTRLPCSVSNSIDRFTENDLIFQVISSKGILVDRMDSTRDKWLWLGIFGISVEDYDCRLLRPTYRTHDGSPPSADMFGITSQKIWSKMTSSYTIVNVLNTATETAEKALFSPVPRIYLGDSTQT